jgi:hypothetical protein
MGRKTQVLSMRRIFDYEGRFRNESVIMFVFQENVINPYPANVENMVSS